MKGAAKRIADARSHERFCIQVTSNFSRGRLAPAIAGCRVHSSHSSFREEVFSSRHHAEDRRSQTAATGSARMRWRRANILAPGFRVPQCGTHPLSRLHPRMLSGIGPGKLYPVTAAQLLPNLTGIPRTAPRPQLTKNCPSSSAPGFRTQDIFQEHPFPKADEEGHFPKCPA